MAKNPLFGEDRYSGLKPPVAKFCKKLDRTLVEDYGVILNPDELKVTCVVAYSGKNMILKGPPGTGKTTVAKALSKVMGKKYERVTAYPDMDVTDIFGDWDYRRQLLAVQSGESLDSVYSREYFISGPALKALEESGILHVDEVNRAGEGIQNALLELAEEKQVTIPLLGEISGNVQIVGTINEGDYGTVPLSSAFRRRFVEIEYSRPQKEYFYTALERKYGKDTIDAIEQAIAKALEEFVAGSGGE